MAEVLASKKSHPQSDSNEDFVLFSSLIPLFKGKGVFYIGHLHLCYQI